MKSREKRYSILKVISALALFFFQLFLIYILLSFLNLGVGTLSVSLLILEIIAVVFIVNERMDTMYKLAWVTFILLIPLFGLIIYIASKVDRRKKRVAEHVSRQLKEAGSVLVQDAETREKLSKENLYEDNIAEYLHRVDNFPVYASQGTKYFTLGEYVFSDLLEKLREAKEFIFLEFFIVEHGIMFDSVISILKEKTKQGVEVRFLYDGSNELQPRRPDLEEELKKYGIKAQMFMPFNIRLSFYMNHRDHRKLVIIDGEYAYTGGFNIADEYINAKKRFGKWKDVGLRITGNAVNSFTQMFLAMWNWDKKGENYEKYYRESELDKQAGYVTPFGDNPFSNDRIGQRMYLNTISSANNYVHMTTPYLLIDDQLKDELIYSARRGVETSILMPSIPDKKLVFYTSRSYYWELLQAGVKIYEYSLGFLHAKTIVADGIRCIVGTINLDYRSLYLHFECGVYSYKEKMGLQVEEDFQKCLEQSREITMEEYYKIPLWQRIVGRVVRLLAPLM